MKVRMLRNPAAQYECRLVEGEEGDVSRLLGEYLVKAGLAVCLDKPKREKPEVKAVPSKPAIAKVKPAAIKADAKVKPAVSEADKPKPSPSTPRDNKLQSEKESRS